jgi:hypothetical protein
VANAHLEADYLFMQGVICARIEECTLFNVRGIDSLVQATENDVRDAVVYVLYEGERIVDTGGKGTNLLTGQRYSALLGLANATQNDEAARNGAAGPMLSKVHKALAGWHLSRRIPARSNASPVARRFTRPILGCTP